jgi:histone-lysine N-methyltransferase SETMAR
VYDPETKRQSMQWQTEFTSAERSTHVSLAVQGHSCVFLRSQAVVHSEFIAQGQTVNQQCYWEVLTTLRESVRRKRPELWPDKWILHHDNVPAHDALSVREFPAKKSTTKMDHPPYSPDLAPCDFRFFAKLNNALKRQSHADIPDIQRNVTTLLGGVPENDLQGRFRQ